LRVADVRTELARPHVRISNGASKGGRPRIVPLWWDAGTLEDLVAWKADRLHNGADLDESFLASLIPGCTVKPLSRHTLRKRFRTACKVLGAARLETLTIHHGRHTLISYALAGGRTQAEVRDVAGHANVSITSGYTSTTSQSCRLALSSALRHSSRYSERCSSKPDRVDQHVRPS
jgi:integrase